jgi:Kef-type K+ transport system membrane component KefB/nucleotide-binding universal stress UspA family protein
MTPFNPNFLFGLFFQTSPPAGSSIPIFISEIVLMLLVGRLLGELMLRIRQPEVLGQLIAGILIGPTVLGTVWPVAHDTLFPGTPEMKEMIDGVSQVGILMLLLLAGIETDFSIVGRKKRAAFMTSVAGIVVPFGCGLILGEFLPDSLLPAPEKRLVTALFLATALSISSIKIVAMVLMEVDFMRRNLGQLMLASAIIDDTIGWIIVAVISGIAAEGVLNLKHVGLTLGGTLIFLGISFSFGRTLVTHIIRWTNDTLYLEFSVLSVILVLMFLMAVLTDLIGVHTVLGAFTTGVLVGQSPMMTNHIREQLRGVVLGLFAPVFFAVAGLSVNLTILADPLQLKLAVGLILIASFGKLTGCFIGAKLGSLTTREAIALAIGMNARGTTEVIVATIGLSIGILTNDFFTLIVIMAVSTTMIMPPMLRWALARIPITKSEKERLKREEAEADEFVPHVERLLIVADQDGSGELAAKLGGLFAGTRKVMATVLELEQVVGRSEAEDSEQSIEQSVRSALELATKRSTAIQKKNLAEKETIEPPAQLKTVSSSDKPSEAIAKEIRNGYDIIFVGLEDALSINGTSAMTLSSSIEQVVKEFKNPLAILVNKDLSGPTLDLESLNILVPISGTRYSRIAAEVAIAIAKGCNGKVTALNVSPPAKQTAFAQITREQLRPGRAVLDDIRKLGKREGVTVKTFAQIKPTREPAILNQVRKGKHNLLVLGANVRPGSSLFFGHSILTLLKEADCSVLVVSS